MDKLLNFLKTTLLGGALIVLPAWLAVLLLVKALTQAEVVVKPVSTHLPPSIGHPIVVAFVLLIAVCFLVGLALRTALGRAAKHRVESMVLEKVPGYTTLRSVAQQLGHLEESSGFKPALVETKGALAPAFIVGEPAVGRYTVFIPSAPTPATGTILIIDAARVHPVDVPMSTMFKCITKWGTGAEELLAAMPAGTAIPGASPRQPSP